MPVNRSDMESLIGDGWVTGPHLFGVSKDVAKKESEPKSSAPTNLPDPSNDPIIMYHESLAPIGKIVIRKDSKALESEGWVDSPAKFSGNVEITVADSLCVHPLDEASSHTLSPEKAKKRAKKAAEEAESE